MARMLRKRLGFIARWTSAMEGWTVNYCQRNEWRLPPSVGLDDMIQEGFLIFSRCKLKYPEVITPGHFFALYKTAFTNHFTDAAGIRTKREVCHTNLFGDEGSDFDAGNLLGEASYGSEEEVIMSALLADAPEEIRKVLVETGALYGLKETPTMPKDEPAINDRLCDMAGAPAGTNMIARIINFLQGAPDVPNQKAIPV